MLSVLEIKNTIWKYYTTTKLVYTLSSGISTSHKVSPLLLHNVSLPAPVPSEETESALSLKDIPIEVKEGA